MKGRKSFRSSTSFTASTVCLGNVYMFLFKYRSEKHQTIYYIYAKSIYLNIIYTYTLYALVSFSCQLFPCEHCHYPFRARTKFDVMMLGKCFGFIFTLGKASTMSVRSYSNVCVTELFAAELIQGKSL